MEKLKIIKRTTNVYIDNFGDDVIIDEQEEENMDKKIRKIEKETKHVGKELKHLEKEDKKRDKLVIKGKKAMKKGR